MAKKTATHTINVKRDTTAMEVVFSYIHKATEVVEGKLTLKASDLHEDVKDFVTLYGMTKIVQDRNSDADQADRLRLYEQTFNETLKVGLIKKDRKASGRRLSSYELSALLAYFKKNGSPKARIADVQASWAKLSEVDKAQVLGRPEVVKLIEAEKKATADVPDALDSLLHSDSE